MDALRKERELLVFERDRLKQEKREGYTRFTQKVSDFSEETNSNNLKEDSEVVTDLQQQLAARDQEIKSLRQKVSQNEAKETDSKSKSSKEEEEEVEEPVGSAQHKLTLNKLIEEQTISSNLRNNNSELKLRVATLETEIEKLHLQNSHNLQLVEQANAAAQAATNLVTANPKQKKKSIFGIRRSGRKKSSMDSPPVKPATGTKKTLSNSQPSLDGSLSEHDIHSLLTKRHETPPVAIPYNPFNKPPDAQLLQTSVKLAMEEKAEVERQLACLRDELNAQQNRIEELFQENSNKERIYIDAVQEIERLRQALQLTTREKELLASETESLCFQNESLRAEKDVLRGKEVKAVLKEKQEMEFLRSENKALMSEIRTLIVNSDGLETSLSQLKREKVAKDVRDHEIKLKLKKSEQENKCLNKQLTELKQLSEAKSKEVNDLERALGEAKGYQNSPKITVSRNSESPPREKHSPSTGQQQSQRTPEKRHFGLPVYIEELPLRSRILHERAQSEDFTSQQPYMKSKTIPMQRTSSGGTKVLAVQTTLPTMETPLKVADKSLLFTSDSHGLKLGSFQPLSPKSSGVNSLVKMFETGKPKDEEPVENINNAGVPTPHTENEAPSQTPSSSSSRETTPARRSSANSKDQTPTRERKLSSSSSPGRRNSKGKEDEEVETKQVSKNSERKKSSSSRSTSPSLRKKSTTTSGLDIKGDSSKSVSNSSLKGATSKTSREKSPTKERKNSGGSSVRKFSHGSSEAKYLPRKDDLRSKDQSHRRTTSLVISKDQKQRVSPEKTEHSPSERAVSPRSSVTQKVHESPDVSKLNTIAEKTKSSKEDGTKLTVSKHVSRISVTVEDKMPDDSNNAKGKSPMSPEKSQTWPTKTSSEIRKVESSNNTLPLTNKGGEVSEKKSTSPTQLTPLSISKPKPPPTAILKSSSMPRSIGSSPAPPLDETPAGIVQNLRSSWEKKSHNSPLKPIAKTASASTPSSSNELSGSYSQSPVNSPIKPITKTGSGPPGVILYSPSIKKPSPPPSTSAAPLSPTTKFSRSFHSPLVKMESSPLISNLPRSTPATPSTAHSTSTNTSPAPHQNGISSMSYNKGSVSKRISSFEPSASETEVQTRHSPTANGTSISPRMHRRPASLYVSSPSGHNAEGKQLSSLLSILQEKTSCSPPPPVENKVNVQPKKKFEQYVFYLYLNTGFNRWLQM